MEGQNERSTQYLERVPFLPANAYPPTKSEKHPKRDATVSKQFRNSRNIRITAIIVSNDRNTYDYDVW